MAIWDPYLTQRDREHAKAWGKKRPFGFGERPALLVIDDYYSVLGFEREPLMEAIKTWPGSCGLEGWEAIDKTVELIAAARENRVPVIYTRNAEPFLPWQRGGPRNSLNHLSPEVRARANDIVDEVAPQPEELVIEKAAPSGFHGTPLLFHLNWLDIDTLITCGETTSGCVRATVVDGCTYRFRMGVVADCSFDRTEASHYINLFDMDNKYADVIDLDAAITYFASVGAGKLVAAGR